MSYVEALNYYIVTNSNIKHYVFGFNLPAHFTLKK